MDQTGDPDFLFLAQNQPGKRPATSKPDSSAINCTSCRLCRTRPSPRGEQLAQAMIQGFQVHRQCRVFLHFRSRGRREAAAGEKRMMHLPLGHHKLLSLDLMDSIRGFNHITQCTRSIPLASTVSEKLLPTVLGNLSHRTQVYYPSFSISSISHNCMRLACTVAARM
jgi:hypothetical protein